MKGRREEEMKSRKREQETERYKQQKIHIQHQRLKDNNYLTSRGHRQSSQYFKIVLCYRFSSTSEIIRTCVKDNYVGEKTEFMNP